MRAVQRFFLCMAFFLSWQSVAQGQAVLFRMLFDNSGKNKSPLQSSSDRKLNKLRERLQEVKAGIDLKAKQWTSLNNTLAQEMEYYRKRALRLRGYPRHLKAKRRVLWLRAAGELNRLAESCLEVLMRLQAGYISRGQSRRNLKNALENRLEAFLHLNTLLKKNYPPSEIRSLRRTLRKVRKQLKKSTHNQEVNRKELKEIDNALEQQQGVLDRLRRQLFALPLAKQPATNSKPSSLPASQPGNKIPTTQALQKPLQRLATQKKLLQFNLARLQLRLFQVRQEDERLDLEASQVRVLLYQEMLAKMKAWERRNARLVEGGLLYRKPFLWGKRKRRPKKKGARKQKPVMVGWSISSAHLMRRWRPVARQWNQLRARSSGWFWGGVIAICLVLLALTVLCVRLLAHVQGKFLEQAASTSFVRLAVVLFRSVRELLPFLYLAGGIYVLAWVLAFPPLERAILLNWLGLILATRVSWTLLNSFFAKQPEDRFFVDVDTRAAQRMRRVLKSALWITFAYLVLGELGRLVALSVVLQELLFGAWLLLLLVSWCILALERDAIISTVPRSTTLSRVILVFTYQAYVLWFVVPVGLFVVFLTGYQNLAFFLLAGVVLSGLVLFVANWLQGAIDESFDQLQGSLMSMEAPPPPAPVEHPEAPSQVEPILELVEEADGTLSSRPISLEDAGVLIGLEGIAPAQPESEQALRPEDSVQQEPVAPDAEVVVTTETTEAAEDATKAETAEDGAKDEAVEDGAKAEAVEDGAKAEAAETTGVPEAAGEAGVAGVGDEAVEAETAEVKDATSEASDVLSVEAAPAASAEASEVSEVSVASQPSAAPLRSQEEASPSPSTPTTPESEAVSSSAVPVVSAEVQAAEVQAAEVQAAVEVSEPVVQAGEVDATGAIATPETVAWFKTLGWVRLFLSLVLWVAALGLLLESWEVPGGFLAIGTGFTYPIFQLQGVQITFWSLCKLGIVMTAAVWLARLLERLLEGYVYPVLKVSVGLQFILNTSLRYLVVLLALLVALQWMGIGLGGLAFLMGVLVVVLAFGMRRLATNFISGLVLLFGRPIAIDDFVGVGKFEGKVRKIGIRSTLIEAPNKRMIIVPNAVLMNSHVVNWMMKYPYVRARVDIGVPYGSELVQVQALLVDIAKAHAQVLEKPAPIVRLRALDSNAMLFGLTVTVADPLTRFRVLSELRLEVVKRFAQAGLKIALPQREIHLQDGLEDALTRLLPASAEAPLVLEADGIAIDASLASGLAQQTQAAGLEPTATPADVNPADGQAGATSSAEAAAPATSAKS